MSGDRHLLSSETGEGCDAARILLPEVRAHLAGECGGPAGCSSALPDRDLLIAGSLQPGDGEFGGMFATFVADLSPKAPTSRSTDGCSSWPRASRALRRLSRSSATVEP